MNEITAAFFFGWGLGMLVGVPLVYGLMKREFKDWFR